MRRFATGLVVSVSSVLIPLAALAGDQPPGADPVSPIPEPAAALVFAVGAVIVAGAIRRRRR